MKTLALLLCFVGTAAANIQSISDLTPDGLVGTWEALAARDGIAGPLVFQMSFSAPNAAYLIITDSPDTSFPPRFLGKLTGSSLVKGNIHLKFSAVPPYPVPALGTDYEYDRVEIEARATSSGDVGSFIEGTMVTHRSNGKESKLGVCFVNKFWVRDLAQFSKAAQEIINNVRVHD